MNKDPCVPLDTSGGDRTLNYLVDLLPGEMDWNHSILGNQFTPLESTVAIGIQSQPIPMTCVHVV